MKLALCLVVMMTAVAPRCLAGETPDVASIETLPPSVVSTAPQCEGTNVDPALGEISTHGGAAHG